MSAWTKVPSLRGSHAMLEPMTREHVAGLQAAAADGKLWKLWYTSVPAPEDTLAYVEAALADHAIGRGLPFVVCDADGQVVGSTRFARMSSRHRRVEIGWTWYARRVQRSAINTEAKLLLLTHAFEVMDCACVQFRSNWFNHASRAAITRMGAKQDGVLRNHQLMPDGSHRDTVVFSIIATEWPAVKANLQWLLRDRTSSGAGA